MATDTNQTVTQEVIPVVGVSRQCRREPSRRRRRSSSRNAHRHVDVRD
jgi:hypothetical protein